MTVLTKDIITTAYSTLHRRVTSLSLLLSRVRIELYNIQFLTLGKIDFRENIVIALRDNYWRYLELFWIISIGLSDRHSFRGKQKKNSNLFLF